MSMHKIQRSIYWDDAQYLVEDLDSDFAATRITPDGTGLFCALAETAEVLNAADTADGVEIGRAS